MLAPFDELRITAFGFKSAIPEVVRQYAGQFDNRIDLTVPAGGGDQIKRKYRFICHHPYVYRLTPGSPIEPDDRSIGESGICDVWELMAADDPNRLFGPLRRCVRLRIGLPTFDASGSHDWDVPGADILEVEKRNCQGQVCRIGTSACFWLASWCESRYAGRPFTMPS